MNEETNLMESGEGRRCAYCGNEITTRRDGGRPRRFCSDSHKVMYYRENKQRMERDSYQRRIDSMDAKIASQADQIHRQSLAASGQRVAVQRERDKRIRQEERFRMAASQIDRLFASGTLKADHDSQSWEQDRNLTQWQDVIGHYADPDYRDPDDGLEELDRQMREGQQRWNVLREQAVRELGPHPTPEERKDASERIDRIGQLSSEWTLKFLQAHPRLRAWYNLRDYADDFHCEYGYWPDERIAEYARLKDIFENTPPDPVDGTGR